LEFAVPRPSQNLDQKLLKAGCELIQEEGLSKLSLRAVAKRAGVNLGMFHYHFKNKAEFSRRCTGQVYTEFYRGFEQDVSSAGGTLERLRRGLQALGRFSREQRHFMLSLMRDLEDKNTEAWTFLKSKFPPPHGKVIAGLIVQGQKEGLFVKVPVPTAMAILMSSIAFPNFLAGLAERVVGSKFLSLPALALKHYVLSDEALDLRVELALRSLMKHPEPTITKARRKR
jgi:AcrR family transcriptional regulator